MRRPKLILFHMSMILFYIIILGSYRAGLSRLVLVVETAAISTCMAILIGCGIVLSAAWRSSETTKPFISWVGALHLQWWRGHPEGAAAPLAYEPDRRPTVLDVTD